MASSAVTHFQIDSQIMDINKVICNSIEKFDDSERGILSQIILAQLRNFVEHIMLKTYANGQDIEDTYKNICDAIEYVKTKGDLKFLRRFHDFLQISASHYTLEEESSERLMLKYYEYLIKIKDFLKKKYNLNVLGNLNKFPLNTDSMLLEYYEKIAVKVNKNKFTDLKKTRVDRYYIQKIKPFFINQKIYYEVTFTPANEAASKFDRVIAFSALDISHYYAVRLYTVSDSIEILGRKMPVIIIINWETSIRPCEINNFSEIFGVDMNIQSRNSEYRGIMRFLSETGFNLVEIIDFSNKYYLAVKNELMPNTNSTHFFDVLDMCREIIKNNSAGNNIIRYLLYHLRNNVIKLQTERGSSNNYLSNLRLKNGCIPFDKMPFNTSLIGHNPKFFDLLDCIVSSERKHEIFARLIKNNTETNGQLFTPVKDITGFENIDKLIRIYNSKLWSGHSGRRIEVDKGHIFIREYKDDTQYIVDKLKEKANKSVLNYSNSVNSWLQTSTHVIDCPEKSKALVQMFENSTVALVYGSAGTGKSTLINHISHFFSDKSKLYLANTNPAVDNLKRRVTASNCTFSTITKFVMKQKINTNYNILIIDECSTVSNRNMRAILEKASFELLVLVGDIYQIEAIQFGNWFSAARSFIPATSTFELTKPYRSDNKDLLELWKRVRNMDKTILELIAKKGYSTTLDVSIFDPAKEDEIILCLNYDGLYGINNINRFLQESNQNQAFAWGVQLYKINDPILFNESERFAPLIYNNMKGRIVEIEVLGNQIQFDIELDKVINGIDINSYDDLELIGNSSNGNSIVRFLVDKYKSTDEDDDLSSSSVIPFQVAYAVSIHKAQGLEFNSVKIVITDEIDELITHNIFYTAITRAREKLKIYWTPEVEKKVLSSIKPKDNSKDVALLKTI